MATYTHTINGKTISLSQPWESMRPHQQAAVQKAYGGTPSGTTTTGGSTPPTCSTACGK